MLNEVENWMVKNTPRKFQPVLSSISPPSPKTPTSRPIPVSPMKPSLIPNPRPSPILTSHQLKSVASTIQKRQDRSPLPFPAAQMFQNWEHWSITVNREDPTVVHEGQYAVSRVFRRVDRSSRKVIVYSKDRLIPDTALEEISSKFSWYKDELINEIQRTFDVLGKDN
ncbi:hypothetical protein O181_052526 [Austropuccinia psidii MF-1]|uniref:Uncharacterized protein n=1 Tax=Austropuccinia psidii MF-1 TaxID=1389203 RepID=A0A9Q3E5R7_9BASI|nr:hypothetical protein [Austropuccinia psidii MF-1]